MSDERIHDIHDAYTSVEQDADKLALLLHSLLKPNRSARGYDSERRQLIEVTRRMHDNLNLIVSKTLEHDRQRRNRAKKASAA